MEQYKITAGTKANAIEVYFESKPSAETREALKGLKMRWNGAKACWYGFATAEAVSAAINGDQVAEVAPQPKKSEKLAKAPKLAPLWERVNTPIESHYKEGVYVDTKKVAAETRAHLKALFPECKFSVRIGRGGWAAANEVNCDILASPYELIEVTKICWGEEYNALEPSAPLKAIYDHIKAWLWSFNYDNSDSMTDYFDRGFYESINIRPGEYKQTEPTAEQLADVADFMQKKAEAEERAEKEAIERYEREAAERKKAEEEAEKKHRENLANLAEIEASAQVQDLAESEQYFVTNLLAGIGKECSIEDLHRTVEEFGGHIEKLAHIARRVVMSEEHWKKFSNLFMYDTNLVAKFGGTNTNDPRVNNDNFLKLNAEQRAQVEFYVCNCVAIYTAGEQGETLQAVIDPEGYDYSRYVFLPTEETADNYESYEEYKTRAEGQTLAPFFFPLPIEEQAQQAAENVGEVVTALYIDPWILTTRTICGTLKKADFKPYAQYKNNMCLQIDKFTANIHENSGFIMWRGVLPDVPQNLRETPISDTMKLLNYCGEGAGDYIKNVANYYNSLGFAPIVDNVQR